MAEKGTVMVLKVDLQCPCCYKKVKKILCEFPQIRDQVYDEKANTVTIIVVCCNPEKVRDKLCCRGCKIIKSIEIKEPEKPKPVENPKEPKKPKEPEKPKEHEKPKESEKPKEKSKSPTCPVPRRTCCRPCYEGYDGGPCYQGYGVSPPEAPKPASPKSPELAPAPPPPQMGPRTCCRPCFEGYGGGPCYHGYGVPPPPEKPKEAPKPASPKPPEPALAPPPPQTGPRTCCRPCYEGYGGGPCYHGYGVPPPPEKSPEAPKPTPQKPPEPAPAQPPPQIVPGIFPIDGCQPNYPVPGRTCCRQCYEGYGGGPCYQGYGVSPPRQSCYDCGCGCGQRNCHVSKCDYYFSEDNPRGCSIM